MQRGNRGFARFDDKSDGLVEQFVRTRVRIDRIDGFHGRFARQQAFDIICRSLPFDVGDDFMHFVVGYKRTLQTGRLGIAGLEEQQVAVFQQVFRAHLVEDGAAVDFALHGKGHARRDVGLN